MNYNDILQELKAKDLDTRRDHMKKRSTEDLVYMVSTGYLDCRDHSAAIQELNSRGVTGIPNYIRSK